MKTKNLRWLVIAMVFIATGLSFLDRQVLSIAIIKIQEEFHLTDVQYGWVNTAFLISYALMFTLGGRLIDLFGGKTGLAVSVGIWSLANTLHGVMSNFQQLIAFRFLLGVGEGGCFPGAAKTVTEWFGKKERALANGIAIGGSAIGAVIAPPLTIWISMSAGWRWSFVVPGLIGLAWVLIWLLIPRPKAGTPPGGSDARKQEPRAISFFSLLKIKEVWIFVLIRFLLDPVFYFLMFWIPKYLSEVRGVSYERIGDLFWIPFLALGVSNILGGWFSDKLIGNRISTGRARRIVMGLAAFMTMCAPFIAWVSTVGMAVFLMAVIMFAHGFWITNYITSIADMFGNKATSTVVGLSGTAGAISALVLNPLIGWVVQGYSYDPLWVMSGLMYPLAFLIFVFSIPRHKAITI